MGRNENTNRVNCDVELSNTLDYSKHNDEDTAIGLLMDIDDTLCLLASYLLKNITNIVQTSW